MSSFHLTIVTPFGSMYDGEAERLTVRTTEGEATILARHINYAAALDIGVITVVNEGFVKKASCAGGMLAVTNGEARVIAKTFEWSDNIDLERAKRALDRAESGLSDSSMRSKEEIAALRKAKKRAELRIKVATLK